MLEHINTAWGKAWVSAQYHGRRGVFLPLVYVDINDGNLTDALVFAQIMYWHEPNRENGKSRLRIKHEGQWWLAKNHGDWWAEVRINKRVVRDCLERIRDRGLIVYELHGMSGKKTPYIRVNWEQFEQAVKAATQPDTGLLTPPDEMGMGSNGDGATPDETGSPPCPETYPPLPEKVKPNTEIVKDSTAENTAESLLDGEADWRTGPVPIPKLLLLPAPKVNAVEAIAFFKANIDAVNPYLETVIETACRNYGLAAVMAALKDAAAHNAKGWAYVATILERTARDQAEQVVREKEHQDMMAELAAVSQTDEAGLVPTKDNLVAGDAVRTWELVISQMRGQMSFEFFIGYLRDLRLVDWRAATNTFVIDAPTQQVRDLWATDTRFNRHISKVLGAISSTASVKFIHQENREAA